MPSLISIYNFSCGSSVLKTDQVRISLISKSSSSFPVGLLEGGVNCWRAMPAKGASLRSVAVCSSKASSFSATFLAASAVFFSKAAAARSSFCLSTNIVLVNFICSSKETLSSLCPRISSAIAIESDNSLTGIETLLC